MGKVTFSGGVHPWDGKELSKDKPIERLNPKSEMVFPMAQHIGAPANPVVELPFLPFSFSAVITLFATFHIVSAERAETAVFI